MDPDDVVVAIINGSGDIQKNQIASYVITLFLAITAVGLRFWARKLSKARYWWDDWLIIIALILAAAEVGVSAWWTSVGGGKYIGTVTSGRMRQIFLCIFVTEMLYGTCMFFVRASAVLLLIRIFPQKWARWYCTACGALAAMWTISVIIVSCLQCQPIWGFWDRITPGSVCSVDLRKFYLPVAIAGCIIDTFIIMLPLVLCWRLNLNLVAKLVLTGIFATSFFVTIVSGIRIQSVMDSNLSGEDGINITWTVAPTGMWTNVEMNMGVVSACLPCLRPVLSKFIPAAWVPNAIRKQTAPQQYALRKQYSKGSTLLDDNRLTRKQSALEAEIDSVGLEDHSLEKRTASSDAESAFVEAVPGILGPQGWSDHERSVSTKVSNGPASMSSHSGILVQSSIEIASERNSRAVSRAQ